MASMEKRKKKKGAAKVSPGVSTLDVKDDKDTISKSSSLISVKEATATDQHDMVEKGTAEEGLTKTPSRHASAVSRSEPHPSAHDASQDTPAPVGSMISLRSKQAWVSFDETPDAAGNWAPIETGSRPPTATGSRPPTVATHTSAERGASFARPPSPATNTSGGRLFRPNNAVSPLPTERPVSARLAISGESSGVTSAAGTNTAVEPYESVAQLVPAERSEAHAYVPYVYARDAVSKVVVDMKNMKLNHIRIVHDIEHNFRSIEVETQAQFNLFVLNLRDQYGLKVQTFRQVIQVHRLELQQKDQHWDELLLSLSERNNALLKDKKKLLIQNKLDLERLEREKGDAVLALTTKMDASHAAVFKNLKDAENKHEEQLMQLQVKHEADLAALREEEQKVANSTVKAEKAEVERLLRRLEEMEQENVALVATAGPPTVALVSQAALETRGEMPVGETEGTHLELAAERAVMAADRQAMEKERLQFSSQRDKLHEDHIRHQEALNAAQKECEEWRARYDSMKDQLGELAQVRGQYEALQAQFATVSALAIAAAVDDKTKTNEQIMKVEADRDMMREEKEQMDHDLVRWEEDFSRQNGRAPTEQEQPDSIQELHASRAEAAGMEARLDTEVSTLHSLQQGTMPEVSALPALPPAFHEMEIRTIEVQVPDPGTLKDLHAAQAQVEIQAAEVVALQAQISRSEVSIVGLEEQLAAGMSPGTDEDLQREVTELRAKLVASAALHPVGVAAMATSGDDVGELMADLQRHLDETQVLLVEERSAHARSRDELEEAQAQVEVERAELEEKETLHAASMEAASNKMEAELINCTMKLKAAEHRVEMLDKARLNTMPVDTRKEIKALKANLASCDREKEAEMAAKIDLQAEVTQLSIKMAALEKSTGLKKSQSSDSDRKLKVLRAEKDAEVRELMARDQQRTTRDEKRLAALQHRIQQLEASGGPVKGAKGGPDKATQEKLHAAQRELKDAQNRIKQLEKELKDTQKSAGSGNMETERERKKQEKVLKELEKKLDSVLKKEEKNEANLRRQAEALEAASKELAAKDRAMGKLTAEMEGLGVAAAQSAENASRVMELTQTVKHLTEENSELSDNYNSERVLRKKYYNMVEDMKGKIRVYCRVRPMSSSETQRGCEAICKSPDEFTIQIERTRGMKEFQFDNVFMPDITQERVFEDTNNLVQSAVDGYNVCIFAYGQTGSGKTYTVIGDSAGKSPGIAPRAFDRIYELADEQKSKFSFRVTVYMLELYNDRLLDLFSVGSNEDKMDIRKDKKGMVVVQGAEVKIAANSTQLFSLFEQGSKNRHVASTKMNAESSRSHLVVGIVIESTNKGSGQVTKGKLSLVDLAGSERAAKTDASAEQLKEAMSINKSLSALGDVISALSSEQSFIPYRNNKLTMLMQDSLGGNAKTLMFVNVSPADYNTDETVTSLTYAARVKLITNDANKNADNKEIAHLKAMITKLKKGEDVADDDDDDDDITA